MTKNLSIDLLEKAILGTMLENNYLILDSTIKPSMFQSTIHRTIYEQMVLLAKTQKPVDYLTLLYKLNPQDVGGAYYLNDIQQSANLEQYDVYVNLFFEEWCKREMNHILYRAQVEEWPLEKVQSSLDAIESNHMKLDTSIQHRLVEYYELPFQEIKQTEVVPTVISDLKNLTDGFRNGEVTIIAARPSMGKSDLMIHFALHAGWSGFLPIIFSLEMSAQTLMNRIIATTGKINRAKLRNPYKYLSVDQRNHWPNILNRVMESSIQIDDSPAMTISYIRAQARKMLKTNPSRKPIIFIDYLQIIHSKAQGNQTNIIGEISWAIKQMAKEFNCPIVCLSQLNRSVEGRQNKRPMISDLRDSGNIEQDADVVILLYRNEYYEQKNNHCRSSQSVPIEQLELIVAKNRNGNTGVAYAAYNKATGEIVGKQYGNGSAKTANH